uniref:Reverse transcriptase n=1 Tax=Strongyloides papillosus TaxID=174720 RepID=A0A0N5CAH8_STREA
MKSSCFNFVIIRLLILRAHNLTAPCYNYRQLRAHTSTAPCYTYLLLKVTSSSLQRQFMISSESDQYSYNIVKTVLCSLFDSLPESLSHQIALENLHLSHLPHKRIRKHLIEIVAKYFTETTTEDSFTTAYEEFTYIDPATLLSPDTTHNSTTTLNQESTHTDTHTTMNTTTQTATLNSYSWMSVKEFDPKENFDRWFKTFNLHLQFDGVEGDRRLIALQLKAGRQVREFIDEIPEAERTFEQVVERLKTTYTGSLSVESASARLISYRIDYRNFRSSLNEYVKLIERANPSTRRDQLKALVEERLMINLKESLSTYLRNHRRHNTHVDEMIEDLVLENDMQQRHHKKNQPHNFHHSPHNKQFQHPLSQKKVQDSCTIHPYSRHTNSECRQQIKQEPQCKTESSHINNSLIKMPAILNDKPCNVLIDTGATCTMVSPTFAKQLGANKNTTHEYITSAGNPFFAKKINIPLSLQIDNCHHETNVDNYVASRDFTDYQVILGMNFLSPLRCSISTHEKKAYFAQPITNFLLSAQNENLKDKEEEFKQLIRQKYASVEPTCEYDVGPGLFSTSPQEFLLTPPLGIKYYASPPSEEEDEIIQQMLRYDIIEESKSLTTLPHYLLVKRDEQGKPKLQNGKIRKRFILDCREINNKTRIVPFHSLSLQILLQQLRAFTFGSTIDLHQGYFQMILDEADRPHYAFKYKYKTYQFKRAPMGARNSPSFFQNNMELLLADIRTSYQAHTNIFIYMDDILILTNGSQELHLTVLEHVILTIHSKGGKISLSKCAFLRTSLKFLSWTFSYNKITPTISPLIRNKSLPATRKELYARLQCYNYFRLSIPQYSEKTSQLYQLTKGPKQEKIQWTPELSKQFYDLSQILFNEPTIYMYDENQPLILKTDGCNTGIGGFLCQRDQEGIIRPLGFFSYPLQKTKTPRSPTYIELLAISKGITTFRYLIQGKQLTIESDHRPIAGLIATSTSPKFMEHINTITQYTTDIKYINKHCNQLADFLSRLFENSRSEINNLQDAPQQPRRRGRPKKVQNTTALEKSQPRPRGRPKKLINPTTNNDGRYIEYESLPLDLSSIQKEDGELISSLEQGNYRGIKIETFNDIIITSDSKRPIITDEQTIQAILKICHDQTGHWNHIATKEIIQQVVYIPDLSTKCKAYASYTLPKILRTDGARYWTSKEVSEYLKTNQVIHSISTPTNSTGNAYAERFIRTLQSAIGKLLLDYPQSEWDTILPEAVYALNHYPRQGSTPFQRILQYAERFIRTLQSAIGKLLLDYPQSEWDTILPEAVYALNHYPRQGSTPFQRILRHKPTTVLQLAMQKSLSKDKLNEAKQVMKTLEASAYIPVKRRTKFQPRFEDQAHVKGISKDGKTLHLQRNDRSYIRPRRNAKLRNH